MNKSIFLASRVEYLESLARPLSIGVELQQKGILDAGGACLAWSGAPSMSDLKDVQRVFLAPTAEEAAIRQFPAFLAGIASLRTLAIPHTFISALSAAVLPRSLACLQLSYKDLYMPRKDWADLRWPLLTLPNVHGIFQHTFGGPSNAWTSLGMTPTLLPSLKFISCEIDGSQRAAEIVGTFPKLRHVELEIVRNARVLDLLPTTVEALSVTAPFQKFSMQGIGRISALRALKINGARCEIDFESLLSCQNLVEINILNSKRLKNVEALLEHPKLKSIYFLDCGKPFKGMLKERFRSRGFDRLEIDFA